VIIFVVALVVFVVLRLLAALGVRPSWLDSDRARVRVALATMFLLASTARLSNPAGLVQMLPEQLPPRREAVYLSGLFEIAGAIGLLIPGLRRAAGWGLAALLVVVLPANVNVALNNLQIEGFSGSPAYQWARLAIQPLLIWLLLWSTAPDRPDAADRAHRRMSARLTSSQPREAARREPGPSTMFRRLDFYPLPRARERRDDGEAVVLAVSYEPAKRGLDIVLFDRHAQPLSVGREQQRPGRLDHRQIVLGVAALDFRRLAVRLQPL
jgi:uncharacterized membrane protein